MIKHDEFEALLRKAVFPLLALMFLLQAYACRGLYADGANFFLSLLTYRALPWYDAQRFFNHAVIEGPVLLLMLCGVDDMTFLRYFFSFCVLFFPLAVWAATLWVLRRDALFWPFTILFCVAYFGINFFAIGEYNLCFALAGYCFAMLLRPLPPGLWPRASLLIAAYLLSLDYASALFFCGLMLPLAFFKRDWGGAPRYYKWCLLALLATAAAIGVTEVLSPRDPIVYARAKNIRDLYLDTHFWCVWLYAVAAMAMLTIKKEEVRAWCVVVCVVAVIGMIINPVWLYPSLHHAVRAFVSIVLTLFGIGIWLLRHRLLEGHLLSSAATFGLLALLSFFDIWSSYDYAVYLEIFRETVNARTGVVPYEISGLPLVPNSSRFMWMWTQPAMSVILRDSDDKAIILNPKSYLGYQPFDPTKDVLDLARYYR